MSETIEFSAPVASSSTASPAPAEVREAAPAPAAETPAPTKPIETAPRAFVAPAAVPAAEPVKAKRGWNLFRRSAKETTANTDTIPVVVAAPKKKRFYQRRSAKIARSALLTVWIGASINTFTWNPSINAGAVSFQHAGEGRGQSAGQKVGNFLDLWYAGTTHAYSCSVESTKKGPFPKYDFAGKSTVQNILGAGAVGYNTVIGFLTGGAGTIAGSFFTLPTRPADAALNAPANTKECG